MNKTDIREFFDHPVGKVFLRTLNKRRVRNAEQVIKGKIYQNAQPMEQLNQIIGEVNLIDSILSGKLLEDEEFEV